MKNPFHFTKNPFRSTKTPSYPASLAAELTAALKEEGKWWAPDPPPHPAVYFHTDNYLTYVIDSISDEVYFRCFLHQAKTHPDPDDNSCAQSCSQFASVSEARDYLNRLMAIAQTFTAPPYSNGYLENDLIAGPVELHRMQHLLSVADIELSESDQALLHSGQYIKRGSFENEYLNQTVKILTARELIGSLDSYLTHLEDCAIDFRSIERVTKRLKKIPFFRFSARYMTMCTLNEYKYYAQRDTGNIIHVNERTTRLLNILYGNNTQQGFPFYGTQLCNSIPASDLVWQYISNLTDISTLEAEWQKLPLSQFSDIALLQTIKLHYKVNHLILARRDYYNINNHESALSSDPENLLTPDEFIQHFPKLAHLKRFVSPHNCRWNPYVGDGTGRRTAIIPVLDEYYALRSITKFRLD